MTEKRYQMRNTNLADEMGRIYYNIQRNDGVNICQVYGKNNAKSLIDELNELAEENKALRSDRNYWKTLAQSLARTNGNVKLKDEHLAWKRVDL